MNEIPFDTTQISSKANYSNPQPGDPYHPLAAGAHPPTIAYALQHAQIGRKDSAGPQGKGWQEEVAFTQDSRSCADAVVVATPINPTAVAFQVNSRDEVRMMSGDGQIAGCITDESRVRRGSTTQVACTNMQVRRLTPVECERLQGFPDGYTAIPWRKKAADQCPDGPRYKALGNSWAVPNVAWIGRRIKAHLEGEL